MHTKRFEEGTRYNQPPLLYNLFTLVKRLPVFFVSPGGTTPRIDYSSQLVFTLHQGKVKSGGIGIGIRGLESSQPSGFSTIKSSYFVLIPCTSIRTRS